MLMIIRQCAEPEPLHRENDLAPGLTYFSLTYKGKQFKFYCVKPQCQLN
jgi:hypothetical protein